MAPVPPAPQIEGALKSTINSIGFGAITTVLAVTFGRLFIPNFFVIIVSFVVFLEFVLLICIPRRKEYYELYQAPGRRAVHNIGGAEVPQINVQGPEGTDGTPKKKQGVRARLKKDHNKPGKKDQLAVGGYEENPEGVSTGGRSSPKRSPKTERKAAKDEGSKAAKDEESKAKEVKAESAQLSEQDDKSKGKGKGGWRKRLTSKSQSEESA